MNKLLALLMLLLLRTAIAQEQPPTFQSGTELVQVSVIAKDKNGTAVAGLNREDFQVYDNGAPQNIALFLSIKPPARKEAAKTPPGVFTNQIATDGSAGYSILLFDNLNVDSGQEVFGYTSLARQNALRALRHIPPGDKVAVYSLWCQFQVFREFTSDRESLREQLEKFAPAPANCIDSTEPQHALTERVFNPGATAQIPNPSAAIVSKTQLDIEEQEIKHLAEHLAGIPGRKSLIWMTSTFQLKPASVRQLINANVAIYPVDTLGSTIGIPWEKEARYAPIRALAAMTGGKAYVDRDDLDAAIGDALTDGQISYTLGFYRPEASRVGGVHRIEVRNSREGVVLRYPAFYSVEAPPPRGHSQVQALVDALNRPASATGIAITAAPVRSGHTLNLTLRFDLASLALQQRNGLWEGQAELVARFRAYDAKPTGKVIALTMNFHLRPATYAAALRDGYVLQRNIEIPEKAADLDLLVGSLTSAKIGTLTIPLAEIGPGAK